MSDPRSLTRAKRASDLAANEASDPCSPTREKEKGAAQLAVPRCRSKKISRLFSSLTLLAEGPVLVDTVEVFFAHAPQAAAGGRVAAGFFSSLTLPAEGPVLVDNVEVLVVYAP